MKKRMKSVPVLLALLISACATSAHAICPDLSLHETVQDCPWAEASRHTIGVTNASALRNILDRDIPGFMNEMDRDADSPGLLALWGLSHNVDESNLATGLRTIPANILEFFVSLWNIPYNSDFTVGHAGVNHTYGYLFSNVATPYGYKRARYTQGELESGFGLTPGLLGGLPSEGTLLSNLTYFISEIALKDSETSFDEFLTAVDNEDIVSVKELVDYPYETLKVKRLVEVAQNADFYLELRTDIVDFSKKNLNGSDSSLLIYTIDFHQAGQQSKPRLITAFPVQTSFAAGLFDPKTFGDQVTLKLKYNAALPVTIPAAMMVGKRYIANESNSTRN